MKTENWGDNIQLTYQQRLEDDYVSDCTITLFSKTPISIEGKHMYFIWEGSFENEPITVTLKRQTPPELALIEGLPKKPGLIQQTYSEIRRILHKLN